jgi:hypothetical protein
MCCAESELRHLDGSIASDQHPIMVKIEAGMRRGETFTPRNQAERSEDG